MPLDVDLTLYNAVWALLEADAGVTDTFKPASRIKQTVGDFVSVYNQLKKSLSSAAGQSGSTTSLRELEREAEIGTAEKLGWVIIIGSVVLTILTVIFL